MRRREPKRPQGQDEDQLAEGGWSEERKKEALKELSLQLFRIALARRLVQRIMTDGLMTSVYDWYEDLERVHKVLSEVHTLLRSMGNAAAK